MGTTTITREQLYERIWSEPATKVALAFGISSVAIKKMCKRMNVPTPPRGYWARLAVGLKMPQTPLPKLSKDSDATESKQIDTKANKLRRVAFQNGIILPSLSIKNDDIVSGLALPATMQIDRLHPRARAFHVALMKEKADENGIVRLNSPEFPMMQVSKASAERVARALHVIYSELESRGVELKPVKFSYETHLGFAHGSDTVGISIEEPVDRIRRKPTLEELRRPSREWKVESIQATGLLHITLRERINNWSANNKFRREEGPNRSIEMLLSEIVERVWSFFVKRAERRAEEEKQRQLEAERRARAEEIRQEAARQERHREKIESLAATRVENLLRAAEWWRLRQLALDYVTACQQHWTSASSKKKPLSKAQQQWLAWAHAEIQAMIPNSSGYPDCEHDGKLDASAIPVDGPYPKQRELPLPPTLWPSKEFLEEFQESSPQEEKNRSHPVYEKSQFQFWLLHRNRR